MYFTKGKQRAFELLMQQKMHISDKWKCTKDRTKTKATQRCANKWKTQDYLLALCMEAVVAAVPGALQLAHRRGKPEEPKRDTQTAQQHNRQQQPSKHN